MQNNEKLQALRANLIQDSEQALNNAKADYENKLRQMAQAKAAVSTSSTGPAGSRRGRPENSISLADHEARLTALREDHEAMQLAIRNEYDAAISQLQNEHSVALMEKMKSEQELARTKMREIEQKLNNAHELEKQDFAQKMLEATSAKEAAERQAETANNAAREWKAKHEDVVRRQASAAAMAPMTTPNPISQASNNRQGEAKAAHGRADLAEIRETFKIPTFPATPRPKQPLRSVNRARSARSQTPNSMLFDDGYEESRPGTQQSTAFISHEQSKVAPGGEETGDDEDEEDRLSSLSQGALDELAADIAACEAAPAAADEAMRMEPPRANSSQRRSPSYIRTRQSTKSMVEQPDLTEETAVPKPILVSVRRASGFGTRA